MDRRDSEPDKKTYVIIVAAGKGSRFGGELPKQFCLLGDKPVLMHTAINIARILPQASIFIVLNPDYREMWQKLCLQHGFVSPTVVDGGSTRWQSVKNAIDSLHPADNDIVLIHDGVRPVVNAQMVKRVTEEAERSDAAIPVVPVTDSLRQLCADGQSKAVDRSTLVGVQTPQAFRAAKLVIAYSLPYTPEFTDDASVYEAAGYGAPALVEGSPLNIKITHSRDIEVAALFMGMK